MDAPEAQVGGHTRQNINHMYMYVNTMTGRRKQDLAGRSLEEHASPMIYLIRFGLSVYLSGTELCNLAQKIGQRLHYFMSRLLR